MASRLCFFFALSKTTSPNLASILPHHRLPLRAPKRLPKRLHIRKRPIHPKLRQRMRIGIRHQPRILRPQIHRRHRRISHEKLLLPRKSIRIFPQRLPRNRLLERRIRNRQPAQIRDALAFHQLPVLMQPLLHFKSIELLRNAFPALPKFFRSFSVHQFFKFPCGSNCAP